MEFYTHTIMSSVKYDSFTCSFLIFMSLSLFSGFVTVSRTSDTIWNRSSDSHSNIYPCISLSGALTSFLHILVFTWHNFSSFQKTSLNMCHGTDLLQMNSTFFLSETVLISSSFLKAIFIGYKLQVNNFFILELNVIIFSSSLHCL